MFLLPLTYLAFQQLNAPLCSPANGICVASETGAELFCKKDQSAVAGNNVDECETEAKQ